MNDPVPSAPPSSPPTPGDPPGLKAPQSSSEAGAPTGRAATPGGGTPTIDNATTAAKTADSDAARGRAAADSAARSQRAAESESLTEQGLQLSRSAQWRAAIDPLRRATELDGANAAAFYYLGDAYNHTDALTAALESFEAAARLQPDHWRALKGVGIVLDRMRRPQEATAAYQRAREAQSRIAARATP
jgi:tetratricopeptide (TPR) repeat protein